jgi:peptidyl-prolyl cis-trans isomerase SurA
MKKLVLSLIATSFLASAVFAQQDTVVEEIVARVNNSIITRADLRKNQEQTAQDAKEQNLTQKQVEDRESNALRDLIDQQLLIQKAGDLGISADADLVKRLDDLRKQMKAGSMEDLQKMAEGQGVSWEEFKSNTKNGILTQKVIGSEVGSHVQVPRDEIQKFYDEHKAEISQPERVRLSEILISTNPNAPKPEPGKESALAEPTPEQVAAAEAKVNDIYQQLKSGAKFDALAREQSNGSTADQGGDLGYFKRNDLAKELEDKTFSLQPGEFTSPIRTRQGFVILRVNDHIQAGTPPLDRVRDQIQEQLYSQKIQPALREYLTKLREDAYIDIKPGYTDTGASPNQTKLIYTQDVGPKTKQVRGKLGVGKKRTVVVVGNDKHHPAPVGSTSELGTAKSEVDAKEKADLDRKAQAAVAAAKAAAAAAEKEKLSHMSPKERNRYLAQKKRENRKEAFLQSKENHKQKQLAKKEAKRKAQEAKNRNRPKDPTLVDNNPKPAAKAAAQPASDNTDQTDAASTPPKKKKSVSWF